VTEPGVGYRLKAEPTPESLHPSPTTLRPS
jgi:hypothetical protein